MENMVIDSQFWKNKKVFITGHTGFKGCWLSIWLKMMGASVVGYSLPPITEPNIYTATNLADGIISLYGNILEVAKLNAAIKKYRPEIIFHLAAQPLVQYSYLNPAETYMVNVMGTVNLLEAIRSVDFVRAAVIVTSDKCYENREWVWGYRESDSMGGFDPYSSSKGCTELVVSAYRRSYFSLEQYQKHGLALASVRAGNVIGGGDWAEGRLVPDLIRSFVKEETCMIRCPNAYRPWQYILDVLQGYLTLAKQLYTNGIMYADAWNFGPSDDNVKSVEFIVKTLATLWGNGAKWKIDDNRYPHEATFLKLDCNKSRTYLGWNPKMSIMEVLTNTLSWYKAYYQHYDMSELTEQQIKAYKCKDQRCQLDKDAVFAAAN